MSDLPAGQRTLAAGYFDCAKEYGYAPVANLDQNKWTKQRVLSEYFQVDYSNGYKAKVFPNGDTHWEIPDP
jgi:hypothetical protein